MLRLAHPAAARKPVRLIVRNNAAAYENRRVIELGPVVPGDRFITAPEMEGPTMGVVEVDISMSVDGFITEDSNELGWVGVTEAQLLHAWIWRYQMDSGF